MGTIISASFWSVSLSNAVGAPRSQARIEAWHRRWHTLVGGGKKGPYAIINEFVQEQKLTDILCEKVVVGIDVTPPKRDRRQAESALQNVIEGDRSDILQYLRGIAHHMHIVM